MDYFNDSNSNEVSNNYNTTSYNGFSEFNEPSPFDGPVATTDETTLLSKVFNWMTLGLGISAVSAYVGMNLLLNGVVSELLFFGLLIAEVILVWVFSLRINKMSAGAATGCFVAYSIINGLTLSIILLVYTSSSIISAFIATAAMFGGAALYGKTTKKDLTSMGSYLFMALLGLIVTSILNLFMHNSTLDFIICIVGIIIFIALTAYDVNKIREFAKVEGMYDEEHVKKVAIWGALQLYLDFINIFLKLLRLMGKRKR